MLWEWIIPICNSATASILRLLGFDRDQNGANLLSKLFVFLLEHQHTILQGQRAVGLFKGLM